MKYDEAGTYELTYKATDECGNESTQVRTIIVEDTSEYPYTVLNISAWESQGGEGGGIHFNEKVTPLAIPKATDEKGYAVISNFVVNGENLGDMTVEAYANNYAEFTQASVYVDTVEQLVGGLDIQWNTATGKMICAYVDNESETTVTPPYSWDSVTVVMTEEIE